MKENKKLVDQSLKMEKENLVIEKVKKVDRTERLAVYRNKLCK